MDEVIRPSCATSILTVSSSLLRKNAPGRVVLSPPVQESIYSATYLLWSHSMLAQSQSKSGGSGKGNDRIKETTLWFKTNFIWAQGKILLLLLIIIIIIRRRRRRRRRRRIKPSFYHGTKYIQLGCFSSNRE